MASLRISSVRLQDVVRRIRACLDVVGAWMLDIDRRDRFDLARTSRHRNRAGCHEYGFFNVVGDEDDCA